MDNQCRPVTLKFRSILNIPVHMVTMQSALDAVRGMLDRNGVDLVLAANPEKVIAARADPELLKALQSASRVIPDGIGVVVASRLLGERGEIARVPGSELMPAICELAATEGHGIFLFGARPEVVADTAARLCNQYPGLVIAGTQHGYVHEDDMPQVVDRINASGARILFVGLGSPRQERWLLRHRARLSGIRLAQGVGGTFDAICGHPRRAPAMIRRLNLEWLYRLLSQPGRIHRQRALPIFAARIAREVLARSATRNGGLY